MNITVSAPKGSQSPSGLAIPTVNPTKFTAVFSDDFSGNALGNKILRREEEKRRGEGRG